MGRPSNSGLSKSEAQKISIFLKGRPRNSGDRDVTQHTMKTNDADIPEESQRELAAGVLKQAAQDLRRFHGATSKAERALYLDAYRWLTVDEHASPFSFLNVCQLLKLAPDDVRRELVGDSSSGALSYWIPRCGRATRRLRSSFSRFFVAERNASASMPVGYA
jgi:hypothetical protein